MSASLVGSEMCIRDSLSQGQGKRRSRACGLSPWPFLRRGRWPARSRPETPRLAGGGASPLPPPSEGLGGPGSA
eukprot:13543476-Alexandrium_andersonii.AAC.1